MKGQGLLFNRVDLPPELVEAVDLMEQAVEMQAKELKDPALTVADCLAMKQAGEKALVSARRYALEAERRLGQILLGMDPMRRP
jgi:hypothetical protein